jgi:hypothetical protein
MAVPAGIFMPTIVVGCTFGALFGINTHTLTHIGTHAKLTLPLVSCNLNGKQQTHRRGWLLSAWLTDW